MKFKILLLSIFFCGCSTKKNVPKYESILAVNESIIKPVKMSADELAFGKSVYESVCNNCHKFYEIKQFDSKQWREITNRMQDKAHLNDVDTEKVYQYIVSNL